MAIVRDEEIRSGRPTVKGTRVSVDDVVTRFYDLGRSVSDISSDLGVSEEGVEEVLRYYHGEDRNNSSVEA